MTNNCSGPKQTTYQYICISQNSIEFTSTVHRKEGYQTTPRKNDASTNDKESGGSLYQMLESSQQISAMGSPKKPGQISGVNSPGLSNPSKTVPEKKKKKKAYRSSVKWQHFTLEVTPLGLN